MLSCRLLVVTTLIVACYTACCDATWAAEITVGGESEIVAKCGDTIWVCGEVSDTRVTKVSLNVDRRAVDSTNKWGKYRLAWRSGGSYAGQHIVEVAVERTTSIERTRKIWVELMDLPPIRITSPKCNDDVPGQTNVDYKALPNLKNLDLRLYVNGAVVSRTSNDLLWDARKLPEGSYSLQLRGTSNCGTVLSDAITVSVPKRLTIDTPAASSQITVDQSHPEVELAANIHPGLAITDGKFVCNGTIIGEIKPGICKVKWLALDTPSGQYSISAHISDTTGYGYDSQPITVTLQNVVLDARAAEERALQQRREDARRQEQEAERRQREAAERQLQEDAKKRAREESLRWERTITSAKAAWERYSDSYSDSGREFGSITGNLSYYYNKYQGQKPDVGAEVWLALPGITIPDYCGFIGMTDRFVVWDSRIEPTRRLEVPVFKRTLADGSGRFEIRDLVPGNYTLVVQSKHINGSAVEGVTMRDTLGRLYVTPVTVKARQTTDASYDFWITVL